MHQPNIIEKTPEMIKKSLMKGIKNFQKKKKIKRENMVMNKIKVSQKMKNKSQLSIEKDIRKCKKT